MSKRVMIFNFMHSFYKMI